MDDGLLVRGVGRLESSIPGRARGAFRLCRPARHP